MAGNGGHLVKNGPWGQAFWISTPLQIILLSFAHSHHPRELEDVGGGSL